MQMYQLDVTSLYLLAVSTSCLSLLAGFCSIKPWVFLYRLVPLSEGRVEADGTLQCAYHGWRFDAEGTCTTIPQAETSDAERKSAGHPRACVAKYPAQVCCFVRHDIFAAIKARIVLGGVFVVV